jgi:uncharacterized protein (DUF2141 family)
MPRLVLSIAALLASSSLSAQGLTVTIERIEQAQGHVLVVVADSESAWNGQAPRVAARKIAADAAGSLPVSFEDLPPGRYAVQVLHDANDNGKLDTNIVGMPIEGYGFSNNPRVMRKAHFDEAVFELPAEGTTISIELR